jgi:hypothetical protein
MEVPLIAAAVFVVVVLILAGQRLLRPRRPPYRKVDSLLTAAERSFYGVLLKAVDGETLVFAKVRLADVLWLPRDTRDRQAHHNRIISKHLDFVLCSRDTLAPRLAIELDDSSHSRPARRERDSFVDAALSAAGLPLLRVPVRRGYSPHDLGEMIRGLLTPL